MLAYRRSARLISLVPSAPPVPAAQSGGGGPGASAEGGAGGGGGGGGGVTGRATGLTAHDVALIAHAFSHVPDARWIAASSPSVAWSVFVSVSLCFSVCLAVSLSLSLCLSVSLCLSLSLCVSLVSSAPPPSLMQSAMNSATESHSLLACMHSFLPSLHAFSPSFLPCMHACIHSFVECIHSLCYQETTTILFFIHIRKQQKKNPIHCILSANRKQQKKNHSFQSLCYQETTTTGPGGQPARGLREAGRAIPAHYRAIGCGQRGAGPDNNKNNSSRAIVGGADTRHTFTNVERERGRGRSWERERKRGIEEERKRGREKSGTHSEKYPTCYDYRVLHSEDTRALTYANCFFAAQRARPTSLGCRYICTYSQKSSLHRLCVGNALRH